MIEARSRAGMTQEQVRATDENHAGGDSPAGEQKRQAIDAYPSALRQGTGSRLRISFEPEAARP